jgi:hypothetical protein
MRSTTTLLKAVMRPRFLVSVWPWRGIACTATTAVASCLALLRCLIGGQADALPNQMSDRLGEFGERRGDAQRAWDFGGEFVVAAA